MAAGAAVAAYFGASGATAAIVAGAVNGAIIGAAVGAVSSAVNGTNILEGMGKGALTGAATGAVAGGVSHAFNAAGGASVPADANVSQVGTGTEAGKQVITAAPTEGGVITPAGGPEVIPTQPAPLAGPTTQATLPSTGGGISQSEYLNTIRQMGKDAFYREATSGAVQAGVGAYASKEEAKTMAEAERAAAEAAEPAGVLRRGYAAPTVSPEYAASRPVVTAPVVERPTAVQVGVTRPTADIRNIAVQKGVLPNG